MVSLTLRQASSYPRASRDALPTRAGRRGFLANHSALQLSHRLGLGVGVPQSRQIVLGIVFVCAIKVRLEHNVIFTLDWQI